MKTRAPLARAGLASGLLAAVAGLVTVSASQTAAADDKQGKNRGVIVIEKQGYFYVGGQYDNPANPTSMTGQMYVEYQIPADNNDDRDGRRVKKLPIVMIHGGAHTGAGWQTRPDGADGWADYFLSRGWPVYVVDRPGVAKSTSLGAFGNPANIRQAEDMWAASEKADPAVQWPQANLHTQWPGDGTHIHGDPNFDQYFAHLSPAGTASGENNQVLATVALLDKIGPAILMPHSAPGPGVWRIGDMRPNLVKAIVSLEPSGPPFAGGRVYGPSAGPLNYDPPVTAPSEIARVLQSQPDGPDLIACTLQVEPARKLPNLSKVPVLHLLSESSYHAPYDHCTAKYLIQAGVPVDFVKLADLGIRGNGHLFLVEKQNLEIARVVESWLFENLPKRRQ